MSTCSNPLSSEQLVAYWANDLTQSELDAADEHLMGCGECSQRSAQIAQITETLRELLPAVVSEERLSSLEARGFAITYNTMTPGERREVAFPKDADVLLHRLQGLSLEGAARVDLTIRDERSERVLATAPDVPFNRAAGEILVACQRHYASLPPNTALEVEVRRPDGSCKQTLYTVLHRF